MLGVELKAIALSRIFGFEIMPAPFVVAHLQLGLLFQKLGVPFSDEAAERAGIFLTNALTGWEPLREPKTQIPFLPEMQAERDAADRVKQEAPILVILGNPPYNGFPGGAEDEERGLQDAYRTVREGPEPVGRGRNDLYVRFFRMAERRIAETTGQGVVCFISNASWLDGQSFPGMRERYLEAFDHLWIDHLNGDKFRTGKRTPTGEPDPSIFSTAQNREGIQPGTAIALLVRKTNHTPATAVHYRDLWGRGKRAALAAEAASGTVVSYQSVEPLVALGYPFTPSDVRPGYLQWPTLPALFPMQSAGVFTARDDVVVDIDRSRLDARMARYFDPTTSDEDIARAMPNAMPASGRFKGAVARARLTTRGLQPDRLMPFVYRPFDTRWLYWELETALLDRPRPDYAPHIQPDNPWLVTQLRARKGWSRPQCITNPGSLHLVESGTSCFPLQLMIAGEKATLFNGSQQVAARDGTGPARRYNLSTAAVEYLAAVAVDEPESLFYHALAVMHASTYHIEHADALALDWARVPLPADGGVLERSAQLGRAVAGLLNPAHDPFAAPVDPVHPPALPVAMVAREGGGAVDPARGDFDVTARWGAAGKGGAVMPGPGRVRERAYTAGEHASMTQALGTDGPWALDGLGETTYDIFLNETVCWSNVPATVWHFKLGGYQVLKKWLSYREKALLHRGLTIREVNTFTGIVRRLTSLVLLGPTLDVSYRTSAAALFTIQDDPRPADDESVNEEATVTPTARETT